eukprot:6208579-Pleurochrysis_carterae.AAC.1
MDVSTVWNEGADPIRSSRAEAGRRALVGKTEENGVQQTLKDKRKSFQCAVKYGGSGLRTRRGGRRSAGGAMGTGIGARGGRRRESGSIACQVGKLESARRADGVAASGEEPVGVEQAGRRLERLEVSGAYRGIALLSHHRVPAERST